MSNQAQNSARKLYLSKNHIDSIDVDASGQRMIVGTSSLEGNTWDGGIVLLDNEGNVVSSENTRVGVSMVRFCGSKLALAAKDDGCVAIYAVDKLDEVHNFRAHDDVVSCVAADPFLDNHFASCSWDGSIHLWDLTSKSKPVSSHSKAHQGHVNSVTYSDYDCNIIVSTGWDGYVRLWDTRQGPSSCCSFVNMNQISSCVSFESNKTDILLVGSDAGDISIVDLRYSFSAVLHSSRVHKGRVRRIVSSPEAAESGLFVSTSDDTTYAICRSNNENIEELKRFTNHTDYVTDIAWVSNSGDGQITNNKTARLYSVSTDKSLIENTVDLNGLFP